MTSGNFNNISSKEELVYAMKTNLNLSHADRTFLEHIEKLITDDDEKVITTNQNKLFGQIIIKYRRQIAKKLNLNSYLLCEELPWKYLSVIETSEANSKPKLFIENNKLKLSIVYNKYFIREFKKKLNSILTWDNDDKLYVAELTTHNLKLTLEVLNTVYNSIVLDDEINTILFELDTYKDLLWDPTLTIINNRIYILNANENILSLFQESDFILEKYFLFNTLDIAVKAGIKIHDSVSEFLRAISSLKNNQIEFLVNRETTVDKDLLPEILEIVKEQGYEKLRLGLTVFNNQSLVSLIKSQGLDVNLRVMPLDVSSSTVNPSIDQEDYCIISNHALGRKFRAAKKIIYLK